MNEEWCDIIGYDGIYQISNLGNIKSFKNDKIKILKPQIDGGGYYQIFLYKNKKPKKYKIHQLVAKYFVPNFKIIYQYDKDDKLIKVWNGALEIERCLKINNSNIIQCCKNKRKTAGGYKWKYEEDIIW